MSIPTGRTAGGSNPAAWGLYIANTIASAHGGGLTVSSLEGETRFTFRMPTSAE